MEIVFVKYALNSFLEYLCNNMIDLLSLLVSTLTLFLGWLAYRRFIVRKAKEQQLDIVLELISEIQKSLNSFTIMGGGQIEEMKAIHPISIFQIAESPDFGTDKPLYFYSQRANATALNWIFFHNYHTHPLLPKKIASVLKEFNPQPYTETIRSSLVNMDVILIGNIENPLPAATVQSTNKLFGALSTASTLKTASGQLKGEIEKWLRSYGVKEINI